ncbi:MAG TPA: rhamnogalacturonan acetylesterase [Candidatus Acidoferrales bacterium]|jgi:lysophospholipase L1-like esterase|nr:rhamnogalacturonan acetylesterase [Candidatus Acidoferrales bacterium]
MNELLSCAIVALLFALGFSGTMADAAPDKNLVAFNFGCHVFSGAIFVSPTNGYSDAAGYGFEPGSRVVATNGCITSADPFYFSVRLPEGNYRVTITLGNTAAPSLITVKAELRRLMLYHVQTVSGEIATRSFVVNLRRPEITGGGIVHLKPREKAEEWRDWDDKLTLEFDDSQPCIQTLIIQEAEVLTVYILGDSTVCDQPFEPWNSWGQMLPFFFKPAVAIANHAESGETIADSLAGNRFEKVFSVMKAGDYLFVQFGHNDMKSKKPDALERYKKDLIGVVKETRDKGGVPVLITSMERKAGVLHPTLAGYPEAVREVAQQEHCALIDLNAMSIAFYKAIGSNLDKAFVDGTHHDNYGSYELARCVVEGIVQTRLPLAAHVRDAFKAFDPSHPDPVETFYMPASPARSTVKPMGN